ncbi:hypothetical protein VNO77_24855 [Canavalia gladiata]|uniref:Uncharacterized protein n=1 Tax=Canavalia gladiata TaxID=3824 RepID=A0AAN9L718_CANGL
MPSASKVMSSGCDLGASTALLFSIRVQGSRYEIEIKHLFNQIINYKLTVIHNYVLVIRSHRNKRVGLDPNQKGSPPSNHAYRICIQRVARGPNDSPNGMGRNKHTPPLPDNNSVWAWGIHHGDLTSPFIDIIDFSSLSSKKYKTQQAFY